METASEMTSHERRPADPLPGPRAAQPAGGLGLAPDRRASTRFARLEEAGAAAVVLPSLFEEQIEHDEMEIDRFYEDPAPTASREALTYFPELDDYNYRPGRSTCG